MEFLVKIIDNFIVLKVWSKVIIGLDQVVISVKHIGLFSNVGIHDD